MSMTTGKSNVPKLYPEQDPMQLEPHFSRHMLAMTAEGLHDKSAIAEQLAYRDQQIEVLRNERRLVWIFCSERLPTEEQRVYFVTSGTTREGSYRSTGHWEESDWYWRTEHVSVWMPRPLFILPPVPKAPG